MPTSIIVAVVTAIAPATGAALGTFFAGTLGKIVTAVIGMAFSMGLSALTSKKPKAPEPFARKAVDRMQSVRSSIEPHRIIYGETRVSGPITFATSSGGGNEYWHMILPLAGHECEAIGDVWFDDDVIASADLNGSGVVTTGKYANKVRIKKYLGSADQIADPDLVAEAPMSEWTSTDRGRGICYVYLRLTYDPDLFPSGLPNVTAIVKGRRVYDPRTGTDAWSANAALCVLDCLRAEWGPEIEGDEWDADWWIAQANLADELVEYQPGQYQKRFTCNGTLSRAQDPMEMLTELTMAGGLGLTQQEGKYKLHLAAYTAPTISALTASDLRGPIEVVTRPARRELFNSVRGVIASSAHRYQPTDFPAVTNATYEAEDNGERISRDIDLPFTQNEWEAQRIAKIVLERSRQGITIRWPGKMTVMKVSAMEIVPITLAEMGWTNKPFRVMTFEIDEQVGAPDLFLQEEASASYSWNYGEATAIDPAPDTSFASPFDPPPAPSGVALTSGDGELDIRLDGTIFARLRISWTIPSLVFVQLGGRTQIEYRKTGDADWLPGPFVPGSSASTLLLDVADGDQYDVRIRHLTSLGVASSWATTSGYTVEGKAAKPSAPQTLTVVQLADGSRRFDWSHPDAPKDVLVGGGYRIRYALTPEQDWADMTPLHTGVLKASPHITVDLPAGTYNFSIVSVDSSENESATQTKVLSVVLTDPPMAGALYFADERGLGWPGVGNGGTTGCFVDADGTLQSTGSKTWADLTSAWSTYTGDWFFGGTRTSPMTYETDAIDLGAKVLVKPIIVPVGVGTITVEQKAWDSSEPGGYSAIGQATARYWRFKVTVTGSAPSLSALPIILDAPSVSDFWNDINTATEASNSSPAGSSYFYRASAGDIYLIPRNGIGVISVARINALQAVSGAWTWELVSKNATKPGGWTNAAAGPAAQFKIRNATPALADALIDVELRGPRG